MSVTRPCICNRFIPGRPYRQSRDCAKCWMFAHRPAVRKAWGGDPADCASVPVARRDMSAEVLADLLVDGPLVMPEGWRLWPVAREAHLLLTDRFLANVPPYPLGRFAGRGAVIPGGGAYEASAYVACSMLRHVGWDYPIQVWHRGVKEPVSDRIRRLPGVEVVDSESHPAWKTRRMQGGWESKLFAVINSPFEEVLMLDADCYPIYNPDECFEPQNNPHGIVTWPDTAPSDANPQWASYGVPPDGQPGLSGGYYVLTKRIAWPVLQLAQHYDNHSDYYYCKTFGCAGDVGGLGDQDQMRVAIHKLGFASHRYIERPLACSHGSLIHAGPSGRPLFVHRFSNKFGLPRRFPRPPEWYPGNLPMEATAWRYFLEWQTSPVDTSVFPDEVPGWFTRAECALWQRICSGRDVLELGRHHGRSTIVAASMARKVVSLDRMSDAEADFWLQRYGVRHRVWLRIGQFAVLIPTSGGPFSACLIDGDHDSRSVAADIAAAVPHLIPGAAIGFHDYADPAHPDVQPTVDRAAREHGWKLIERADALAVFVSGVNGVSNLTRLR
ncbi:MAG TPA: class I SAM-dependent methyltransferase [Gemmata sp.]|nr:class I SAM-dependent methyltransferase [Gemmata sp.]